MNANSILEDRKEQPENKKDEEREERARGATIQRLGAG